MRSVTSPQHMSHTEKQDVACHTKMGVTSCSICSHVCFPLQSILFLKQDLTAFWTPIDVLSENNSPKSVAIPKVVTFGAFTIK